MIIGIGLLWPVAGPALAAGSDMPSPVAFSNALELGAVGQARDWLEAGMSPDFMGSRIGSGLMIGAWEGNIRMMELFLSRGAHIDLANANGETALALAAWQGKLEAVKWLVDHGASVNAPARHWSALHYAAFADHPEVVDYLLDRGADVNALTTNGSSVLMMAVYEGHDDMVRKLIEKGADRGIRNDRGDGALAWAMRYNHLDIARMVSKPEEFNIAVSRPKESWGEGTRSLAMSPTLQNLLVMRERLVERHMSTGVIDQRIAAERVRIVRQELDRPLAPTPAAALEITASRKQPAQQSVHVIGRQPPAPGHFKVPPPTFFGKPKMPVKAPVRDY